MSHVSFQLFSQCFKCDETLFLVFDILREMTTRLPTPQENQQIAL